MEMNPYYARESAVGPVFDVATFSRGKAVAMGVAGLVFAALVGVAALYVWNPTWLVTDPPEVLRSLNQEIAKLWREYPQGTRYGVLGAALVALLFVVSAGAYLFQSFTGQMYFRVGEGGISFRVPRGFRPLALDLPWEEIVKLTVTQEKRLGALSRNSGNLGGHLTLRTRSHGNHHVGLDDFRQPAHLIHDRIQEAMQMRPAELTVNA